MKPSALPETLSDRIHRVLKEHEGTDYRYIHTMVMAEIAAATEEQETVLKILDGVMPPLNWETQKLSPLLEKASRLAARNNELARQIPDDSASRVLAICSAPLDADESKLTELERDNREQRERDEWLSANLTRLICYSEPESNGDFYRLEFWKRSDSHPTRHEHVTGKTIAETIDAARNHGGAK